MKLFGLDLEEYQDRCFRSLPDPHDIPTTLGNCALGANGELGELVDMFKKFKYQGHEQSLVKIKNELGDVLFYSCVILKCINYYPDVEFLTTLEREHATENDVDSRHPEHAEECYMMLAMQAAMMSWEEIVTCRDGSQKLENVVNKIGFSTEMIIFRIHQIAKLHGMTLQEIADANYNKLLGRYPDGFSVDRSVNRVENGN